MATQVNVSGADLELIDVRKDFPGFTALDDMDLHIPAGEFFALLGPSGCGKTTTLRIVAGLETPTQGQVLLGGQDVTSMKPHERPVNTVFQSYALFPHLDVSETVAFGLKARRFPAEATRRRVQDALAMLHLEGFRRRHPHQLSGGERQRVALARAFVTNPRILLLDEPFAAVDTDSRPGLREVLKNLLARSTAHALVVSHDQADIENLCGSVVVLGVSEKFTD